MDTTRTATPARWDRAFARATAYGIVPRKIDTDYYSVKSSNRKAWYVVHASPAGMSCTCQAGESGDPVCWHRAAVMLRAEARRV